MSISTNDKKFINRNRNVVNPILGVTSALNKGYYRDIGILSNNLNCCVRDDKFTLQGIREERAKAKSVLDRTRLTDLGLLRIFILEHPAELYHLKVVKQCDPNRFEDAVMVCAKWLALNENDIEAVANIIRVFAETNVKSVNDYGTKEKLIQVGEVALEILDRIGSGNSSEYYGGM